MFPFEKNSNAHFLVAQLLMTVTLSPVLVVKSTTDNFSPSPPRAQAPIATLGSRNISSSLVSTSTPQGEALYVC